MLKPTTSFDGRINLAYLLKSRLTALTDLILNLELFQVCFSELSRT